jgi:hypothetical protein
LTPDYDKVILKIDSHEAQGFVGSIGTGEMLATLGPSVNPATRNPGAAILVVSLD